MLIDREGITAQQVPYDEGLKPHPPGGGDLYMTAVSRPTLDLLNFKLSYINKDKTTLFSV